MVAYTSIRGMQLGNAAKGGVLCPIKAVKSQESTQNSSVKLFTLLSIN